MARHFARACIASAALVAALVAHARIPVTDAATRDADVAPPRTDLARIATLGFEALVADYHWLQAVQLVGHERSNLVGDAPLIEHRIESVVALDPFVGHPYRFASLWLVNDAEQVRAANRILERGIAYHPEDWRNRFYLSFNHFFYLGDDEAAARELERAVGLPGAPKYLGRLQARLRSGSAGGLDAARAYLEELVRQTDDPWKRAEYEKALDEIETEERARVLDQARAVFVKRNGRDVASVEELALGADPVLRALPEELHGWGWVIEPEGKQIVSAYYGRRYRVNLGATDLARREQWSKQAAGQEERKQ